MRSSVIVIAGEYEVLAKRLAECGYRVINIPIRHESFRFVEIDPDIIIISPSCREVGHIPDVIRRIRSRYSLLPIITIIAHSSEELIISAFRAGVNDYFKAPFDTDEILENIKKYLKPERASSQGCCGDCISHKPRWQPMIGESRAMQKIRSDIVKIAAADMTVLITGETGTGKDLVAELIHRKSPRREFPFVCVNCPSLPETLIESEMFGYDKGAFTGAVRAKRGKFELAAKGSLFLDEIGDMSLSAQSKLLRVIEKKEIFRLGGQGVIPLDVRLITATNKDPEKLVAEGKFREDLFYRLNIVRIHAPPLRERKSDLLSLTAWFIQKMNQQFGCQIEGLTENSKRMMYQYEWPGNIRELKNVIAASFINLPRRKTTLMDLPQSFKAQFETARSLPKNERRKLVSVLMENNWNKSRAARKLNWSRMTVYRKIAKYNIVEKRARDQ
ncbi:sigma-54-dependent Fis family transcriptional re gulator [Desulfonema ishimotonii]|uniref:Sigma-54-dependent Fis family transcriptional re gulator n=1 Tax=Desulfonema ishimotonii TaxID=45657 RepID=A0A401FTQ7_9BACT|nr:sigma-54 dependent transcriptional regulator [Desulfonema ishimotonii]GBC60346.1 sigma-54-dependent Fis family transcriptional re gulator [Desulfonema ishimotonii]